MATGGAGTATSPQPIVQPLHRGAPAPAPAPAPVNTVSPPSKRELASWWKKFRKTEKEEKAEIGPGIFGVPLPDSIRYANVAISLQNENGESFIYGYVPIVVAKCGVFLKEKATDIEGIFRLSGSAKRIKELQTIFDSPDRYGKGLDWTGYTVHDAANILRRYLNQLPEPIVPLDFYERFRAPLRKVQSPTGPDGEMQPRDMSMNEHSAAVSAYQKLITELPPLNRQLLLYLLDLLAVFASKSDLNRMTAANLAAIFQPGIISHPSHDMSPAEYRLSQDVLIFLIENQDNFLIGMSGTGLDEKTQKDVESGAPSTRSPKAVGRSASNASAGADSLRKFGVRRNVSVSSRGSRERGSPGVSSPGTPSGGNSFSGSGGVARSNTVPSKRSPAIPSNRFQRPGVNDNVDSTIQSVGPTPQEAVALATNQETTESKSSRSGSIQPDDAEGKTVSPTAQPVQALGQPPQQATQPFPATQPVPSQPGQPPATAAAPQPITTRERKISNLFPKSPIFGPSDGQGRATRKLQKKQKLPGSTNDSAQSSVNSLHGDDAAAFHTPLVSPDINSAGRHDPLAAPQGPALTNTVATPIATPINETPTSKQFSTPTAGNDGQNHALKPPSSPPGSTRSRSSFTDHSDNDVVDDTLPQPEKEKRRHRWRFSSSAKKGEHSPLVPPPPIGHNTGARGSNSSLGSSSRPRKSFTGDSQMTQSSAMDPSAGGQQTLVGHSSQESGDVNNQTNGETEKKGLFGKWKAKMSQTKEERQAEKERAKSPPRGEQGASKGSLAAIAQEHFGPRGRSFDGSRDPALSTLAERPAAEGASQGRKASMDPGSRLGDAWTVTPSKPVEK
ncbi:GTPase activating protein (GAP) for Rho1p [Cladophialophora chaetospira]|uniref:GTPase activating protein (GAP) for Rho1p n=1 Tax=Cladophialophora chaetospira TaxID=386627 RepID=A0AA38XIC0_9EURO|nr:GTPase activating protein (GAP) for Rho1p [Cladophialophora chaetospira]